MKGAVRWSQREEHLESAVVSHLEEVPVLEMPAWVTSQRPGLQTAHFSTQIEHAKEIKDKLFFIFNFFHCRLEIHTHTALVIVPYLETF